MNGRKTRLMPITPFDFTSIAGSVTIVYAQRIDLSQACSGLLEVCVHKVDIAAANQSIKIKLSQQGWTSEDPSKLFPGDVIAEIELDSNTDDSQVVTAELDASKITALGMLSVVGLRDGQVGGNVSATISVNMTTRSCG